MTLAYWMILADGDVGAGGWLDLWVALDWFRIGGMTGATTRPLASALGKFFSV